MRPGMGRGFARAGVVEAVRVMGMVVAGLRERSKNFVIGFLMRLYVGWGWGSGAGGLGRGDGLDHPGRATNRAPIRTIRRGGQGNRTSKDAQ